MSCIYYLLSGCDILSVLREMTDKSLMIETLREALTRDFKKVIVSTPPPFSAKELMPDAHPWFRVVLRLSGEYNLSYYNDGLKEIILQDSEALVTLPGGFLKSPDEKSFAGAQVIFRDCFTRYLHYNNSLTQWRHTANPAGPCGRHLLQSFCAAPLSRDFDDFRCKILPALLMISLTELEKDDSLMKGKAYNSYYTALDYMSQNLHSDIDRASAAKSCGVTPSHLSRLFRHFGGEDFKRHTKEDQTGKSRAASA